MSVLPILAISMPRVLTLMVLTPVSAMMDLLETDSLVEVCLCAYYKLLHTASKRENTLATPF